MRLCLFGLLLSTPLVAQPTPDAASVAARTARVEGQVISQAGEPLRKATLRLWPAGPPRPNVVPYADTTDSAGKFVFEAVAPGRYSLSAQRTGYLGQPTPVMLTLAAGQVTKDITFKLTPQGVISGRVIDADGDPIPGLQVWTLRFSRAGGQRTLSRNANGSTDDQGSFRIAGLAPGSYYLLAEDMQSRTNFETLQPARARNRVINVDTYYPNAPDAANATLVEVAAGSELRGIEIQMRRDAVFSIRGTIVDSAEKPIVASINSRSANDPEIGLGNADTNSSPDGKFELRNLRPGAYIISADSNNQAAPARVREEVSISDSDIAGLKLTLIQGATLAGTVKREGAGSLGSAEIMLIDVTAHTGDNAPVKDDGTFELHRVFPAKYAVRVFQLPEGAYVKSIRFGGQDVTHSPLDLTSGVSGTLDILISPRGGELLGSVRNQDGAPMPRVRFTVWPKGGQTDDAWGVAAASATDQNGDFRVTGLAPGDYYVAAWEEVYANLTYDSEFLDRFTSQATPITVEEGSHQSVQPKVISHEAAAAEAAKLQ